MAYECGRFIRRLSEQISEKQQETLSSTTHFIRTRYSFSLLRTSLLCLRGSRGRKIKTEMSGIDFECAVQEARLK